MSLSSKLLVKESKMALIYTLNQEEQFSLSLSASKAVQRMVMKSFFSFPGWVKLQIRL